MDSPNVEMLTRMGRMETGLQSLSESVNELKADLKEALRQIQRVGELELEHKYSKEAIERAFTAIKAVSDKVDQVDKRVDALDGAELLNSRLRKALWICAFAVAGSAITMAFNAVWQSAVYVEELRANAEQARVDR